MIKKLCWKVIELTKISIVLLKISIVVSKISIFVSKISIFVTKIFNRDKMRVISTTFCPIYKVRTIYDDNDNMKTTAK